MIPSDPASAVRLQRALDAVGIAGVTANPGAPTVLELQQRLRAYGLPVGGSRADLAARLGRLDALRADPGAVESLKVPELRERLRGIGIDSLRVNTRPRLLERLRGLAAMPEPAPKAPRPARSEVRPWAVVWVNPATLQSEVYRDSMSRAEAERAQSAAATRALDASVGARFLPEFAHGGPFRDVADRVRMQIGTDGAIEPGGTFAEEAAVIALRSVIQTDSAARGPALSGARDESRRLAEELRRAEGRLEDARRRVWAERGTSDPRLASG